MKNIHTFTAMRVYLVGYMASGKTSLGKLLAKSLELDFIDLDRLFEERYRITVNDFFQRYDEDAFRHLERQLLTETAGLTNTVIATGGGTPCFFDNMKFIRESGISVYLQWPAGMLAERLKHVRVKRPLLAGIAHGELENFITSHLAEREEYYCQADLIIDGTRPNVGRLAEMIRELARER